MRREGAPAADQEIRDRVVRGIDRCAVVEAGAGTGKTTLLVARALEILRCGAATLDEVAIITFTEKAAGELKVRLRQAIERALRTEAEARPRLRPALDAIDRAAISTIHAFAASLLRERPVEAGVDPRFQVLDEMEAGLLLDETFDRVWTAALVDADPDLEPALRFEVRPDRIRTLALLAAANRDLGPPPEPPPAPPAGQVVGRFREAVQRLRALLPHCRNDVDKGRLQILQLSRLAEAIADLAPEAALPRLLLDGRARANEGNKQNWSPESMQEVKRIFREMEEERAGAMDRYGGRIAFRLGSWLVAFRDEYVRTLESRGGIDFQGLLLQARDLLRDDRGVRAAFQRRFRFLLVDEFQDTDPLQAEIVFFLSEETPDTGDWTGARPGRGRLFLVGDPKQSIYRFRRADIAMYEKARALVERSEPGARETIRVNFRTVPGILTYVNEVFPVLLGGGEPGGHQPEYVPLAGHRPALGDGPPVRLVPAPESALAEASGADGARELEAALVASLIRRIVEQERWSVAGPEGAARPARWGDVALLFRGLTGVEFFEQAFRSRDIPYRLIGGKSFYARQETRSLQAIMRSIDNPHDALSVAAALRSSFFGCSDEDLLLHVAGGGAARFDYLHEVEATPPETPVGDAFRLLGDLHRHRHDRPPAATIEELFDRTGILPLLQLRPQGEQGIANLLKLIDLARRHETVGDGGFASFVRFASQMEEDEREEAESPTVEEGDEVVRLMTVHKAKGLEFPIVVLADAGGRPGSGEGFYPDREHGRFHFTLTPEGSAVPVGSWGWNQVAETEKRFGKEEQARLLYVAATRARDHLIIPVVPHGGKEQAFLKMLRDAGGLAPLDGGKPAAHQAAGACGVIDPAPLETSSPGERPWRFDPRALTEPPPPDPVVLAERDAWREGLARALSQAARGCPIVTASSLEGQAFEADVPAPSFPPTAGTPETATSPIAPPGRGRREADERPGLRRAIGIAVHAVLEAHPPRGAPPPRPLLQVSVGAACLEQDLGSEEETGVLRLVEAAFRMPLADRAGRAVRLLPEHPFAVVVRDSEAGDILLEGRIDLLLDEGDGCVIVDYKTDARPAGQEEAAFLDERTDRYRPQAAGYALALESLGVRVKEVVLMFLDAGRERTLPADPDLMEVARRAVRASARP